MTPALIGAGISWSMYLYGYVQEAKYRAFEY